jgi:diguanylate cyclase (GGDEF)-like protein/PAS domain S-box-containing protein
VTDRNLDAAFLARILDLSPGIVLVVDAGLTITWANQAGTDLLGYAIDEAIGRSVLDFLDTDWNPEAFASIATALGGTGPRPPMAFRVLAKDGSRPVIEVTANVQLDDPVVGGMVVYARRWTEQWLLDRTLDSVVAGRPILDTLALLVEVAGAETLTASVSFVWDLTDGRTAGVAASSALPPSLRGPCPGVAVDLASQWHALLAADRGRVHDVADLAEPLRTLAVAEGFRALWIWPAAADREQLPTLWAIAWRREPHLDADETRTAMMARLATLASLALARSRTEEDNAYAAAHDAMTGLWNRNSMFLWLASLLEATPSPPPSSSPSSSSDGSGVGVVYLDLDGFKPINDRYGHAAGDRVLVTVAERLAAAAPASGRVGRFGGDEFVFAGPVADADELDAVASALGAAVTEPVELRSGETVRVGSSTGTAFALAGTATADALVERADAQLYRVKHARPTSAP